MFVARDMKVDASTKGTALRGLIGIRIDGIIADSGRLSRSFAARAWNVLSMAVRGSCGVGRRPNDMDWPDPDSKGVPSRAAGGHGRLWSGCGRCFFFKAGVSSAGLWGDPGS